MRLSFVGITPSTPDNNCPAVFVDEETGDIWCQGEEVQDAAALEAVNGHSPVGANEAVVKLPPIMKAIILEAVNGTYERGRKGPGQHPASAWRRCLVRRRAASVPALGLPPGDARLLHAG